MSRLLFEEFVPDAGILNLLENKALVLSGAQQIYIKWWPLRQCCIVYDGMQWVIVESEDGGDVTVRMLLRHYEIGGESNTEFVLERGTGLIQNILDTNVGELREEIVLRLSDLSDSMRAEEQVGLSQRDLDAQLRGDGRERVGSEEFHPSDAQIAAHLFGQE